MFDLFYNICICLIINIKKFKEGLKVYLLIKFK